MFFPNSLHLLRLVFLADILEHLNILNSDLQDRETDKINKFIKRLNLWAHEKRSGFISMRVRCR